METKQFKLVRVRSLDGEIHYVLREFKVYARLANGKSFNEVEAKRDTKDEAHKPLFLVRNE